ncbi:MAG: carbohydrate binding family 9 domain-containing protein [Gemmatimonadetes bacterium]|nr:carbohydrate binding family 9 domain-containing protein [Gemmatimonadota bacterium]
MPHPIARFALPTAHVDPRTGRAALTATTLILLSMAAGSPVTAQDGAEGSGASLDGSPPPAFPASITRDARGRATVRAIRLDEPLVLDGELNESVYSEYRPFGDFVQVTPVAGDPSSERTDVWVTFDDTHVYVTCRCWDSSPPEEWVVNELRRDTPGLRNNENFGVMFDTFYDRRSGVMFYANALGARADYSVVDEGGPNTDWNPVWDVAGGQFEGGWVVEMAIPFKSLRYNSGPDQMWGIQLRRSIRHKNEWTYLNPVPPFLAGPQALNRISAAGTVVGLDLPPAGSNIELKPYAIGDLTTDRVSDPIRSNDLSADAGLDLKYGLTANLTADLTVNTDFAQVEVDEQQVNLTRFSLFFPEKRDFFLEGRGVFEFGQGGVGGFRPGGGGGFGRGGGDAPTLFYSRRIGLDQGAVIPIVGGGRVTGKVGPFGIGALNIQAGDDDSAGVQSTNFTVLRVKRDILERSSIGAIFTNRSVSTVGPGANQVYGVDAAFGVTQDLELGGYWARTETLGLAGNEQSWQAAASYESDRYGASATRLEVGDSFNPGIGFLRRSGFDKQSGSLRFSPRPESVEAIRKLTWEVGVDHFADDMNGLIQSRRQSATFDVEMESSDRFSIEAVREFERIEAPFDLSSTITVPVGRYSFTSYRASLNAGEHRRLAGNVSFQWGEFYDGTIRALSVSRGRTVISDHLSLEPGVSFNLIDLPSYEEETQAVFRLRADYAFTPRMFASSLVQYNEADGALSSNVRFRWEYAPGSELFIVWTDERDTGPGGTGLRSRGLAVKVTRLLRY